MISQAVFLREVLATFRGSELTMGTALLFWLIWTSVGSGIVGRFAAQTSSPEHRFHTLLVWYGVLGYTGVAVISSIPCLAGLTPGELVPYDLQFISLSFTFLPFNVLGGVLFVLGVKTFENKKSLSAGRVFFIEACGSAIAGIVVSIILAPLASNHVIALLCPILTVIYVASRFLLHKNISILLGIIVPLIFLVAVMAGVRHAHNYMYSGQKPLAVRDTKYGRLRVTQHGEITTFYYDASTLFSAPDLETSEYIVHIPMLASEKRNRVLILGSGPGGVIEEVLKYNTVTSVTCVELDPGVFQLAEKYLDNTWTQDPRVRTIIADGREYLERTDETFDVIIMAMPPPLSAVTNRYYTREFFELSSSHLTQNGILGFPLTGAENYVPDDLAQYLASIRYTLGTEFSSVTVLPGITSRFLGSNSPGSLDSLTWQDFSRKRAEIGMETSYVRDYYLQYILSPERMDYFRSSLDTVQKPFINSDLKPTGYFSRTLIQGSLDGSRILKFFGRFTNTKMLYAVMLCGLLLITGYAVIPGRGITNRPIFATIISVGLTEISLEVLAIMAYQSVFGFLYGKIALLTGSYMTGLALGSWVGDRRVTRGRIGRKYLAVIQSCIVVIPLMWIVLLKLHDAFPGDIPFLELFFYLLTACAGLAGGLQFPAADALFRKSVTNSTAKGGLMYAVDLAGSSIGALFTASLMIPLLGMIPVLGFLTVLSLITAGALWVRV
ncbi:MAG: methyltransferase domain-containing protein [Candidatus Latescibacteria bacterium]|nr:methyltransferase domain-containing protein [Candidatus Latescibacterota bacterium]